MAKKQIYCNLCYQKSTSNGLCGDQCCICCLIENIFKAKEKCLKGITCNFEQKNNILTYDDLIQLINKTEQNQEKENYSNITSKGTYYNQLSHFLDKYSYTLSNQACLLKLDGDAINQNNNEKIMINRLNVIINRISCKIRDEAKESKEYLIKITNDWIDFLVQFKEKKIIEIINTQREFESFLTLIKLLYANYASKNKVNNKQMKNNEKQNSIRSLPIITNIIKPIFNNNLKQIKEEFTSKINSLCYNISFDYKTNKIKQESRECLRIVKKKKEKDSNTEIAQSISFIIQLRNQMIISSVNSSLISILNINQFPTYEINKEGIIHNNSLVTFLLQLTQNNNIVSGSNDAKIKLFQMQKNGLYQCIYIDCSHRNSITCLIELKKNTLISSSQDLTLKIFIIESNSLKCNKTVYTQGYINTIIKLNHPDNFAYGTSRGVLNIWDPIQFTRTEINIVNDLIYQVIELSDARIVLCSRNNKIKIVQNDKEQFAFGNEMYDSIALCEMNNGKLISSSLDKSIYIWQIILDIPPICLQVINLADIALKIIKLSNGLFMFLQINNSIMLLE